MSDRPNDQHPDEPEETTDKLPADQLETGGWRTPQQAATPGERHAWRPPAQAPEASAPESWRVPTLPRDLVDRRGGWHLPKPQDTQYSPEDESVITSEIPAVSAEAQPPAAQTGDTPADIRGCRNGNQGNRSPAV